MKSLSTLSLRVLAACLLLSPLLLSVGCEKPRPEPEAVPLPAELKSYTLFQPGTHWIYQDSASQQLDSVWVVSAEVSVLRVVPRGEEYPVIKHERLHLRTRSSQSGVDQVYTVNRNCGFPFREDVTEKAYPCWAIMRGQFLPNSTADEGSALVFPYTIPRDYARPDYLNGTQPYWHSAPLTIGKDTYPDVIEVKILIDASEDGWPAHYYWAPGKGIVRQRVKVGGVPHTRTLVRSHIVQ
ncbi:hypothetical protein [uncultured Hymenobacter sp.]|uniref:hypothetical protein n=1 Tax=uncultured Hymenobacter sp. TaxID=170016 RepID=UPI0035CAB25A